MKKVFSVFALMMGIVSVAMAQTSDNTGDLFEGYTKEDHLRPHDTPSRAGGDV